jgi:hypothetical protein
MPHDGVFPHELPDDLPAPTGPLDDDTAERLLGGRLPPEDAPRPYARVARVLRAAAGPPTPRELAGQAAALAAFRTARGSEGRPSRHRRRGRDRQRPTDAPRTGGRARVVALALAGTLAVGGLWMAAGAQTAPGLRSPTGGPGAAGSGSVASGSGVAGSGTTGSLRPAMPATGPATGDRSLALPSGRDRATGDGGAATGGAHRSHPGHPGKPPKTKPDKPKPEHPKPERPKGGRP